ncbi:MAG: cation:proton antiporter [Cyanobacteriota bacterium]|nr:cation:proton antiporter [Cyanobacteriota bacterium]
MAAEHEFIVDLTTALGASALGGYVANRLRQPVLLGYLASGLIVGPFGFSLFNDVDRIKALAEIGVAFLLFALGVEFSLAEIKRVKDIALKGSVLQIGITIAAVAFISILLGWVEDIPQGIFLGAVLSLSSTAVVLKTLTERGETNTIHGQVMLAVLIAQDLALGLMLAILPALNEPENLVNALGIAVLKALLFFAGAFVAGRWFIPKIMRSVATTESSELFLLTTIALCLGVALITAALGLSIEMGAFVAGLMLSELEYADRALAKILPLRDTFASLFFASIGMLIDPEVLLNNFGIILGLVIIVMVGKAIVIFPIILKFGYSFKTAVIASLGLNQIGEFSFVLALVGYRLDFITEDKYFLLLGTTAITLVLTPIGLRWSPRIAERLGTLPVLSNYLRKFRSTKALSVPDTLRDHVVVAGYGRVGQVLTRILRNRGFQVLAIENSEAGVKQLRQQNIPYIFGDADSELVLEKAHLETAKALAIALPDPMSTRLLLKRALEFAPELDVVARSHQSSEIDLLTQLGAREVVQPEFEAALEMGSHMLDTLGESSSTILSVMREIRIEHYDSIRPQDENPVNKTDLNNVTHELHNQWVTIPPESPLHSMTLAAADIRNLTGVTVMAIEQGSKTNYYPKSHTQLQAGDKLLVVGERAEVAALGDLMSGRDGFSKGYNRWVTLAEESMLVGQRAIELQQQYDVTLKSLRRHGKLYNSVEAGMKLKPEDCVLLRGEPARVKKVAKLAMVSTGVPE